LPFDGLSPNARAGVELGYVFPWLNGSFAAALDVDFAAPKHSGSKSGDPRLPDGTYDWHLTEQELSFMPVVMYRVTSLGAFTPYIGVGPRFYFLRSTVKGSSGGMAIAETTEQSGKVGFGVPAGAELSLGPGAALAELLFEYGSLDHSATGPSNTGGLNLLLGYRFVL
jgi:opacity protein-like surface antigen